MNLRSVHYVDIIEHTPKTIRKHVVYERPAQHVENILVLCMHDIFATGRHETNNQSIKQMSI